MFFASRVRNSVNLDVTLLVLHRGYTFAHIFVGCMALDFQNFEAIKPACACRLPDVFP